MSDSESDKKDPKNIFEKLFGEAPESGYIFRSLNFTLAHRAVVLTWSCQGIGFGELALIFSDKGLDMDTECMSNDFCISALTETIKRIDAGQKATDYDLTEEGMEGKESAEGREPLIKAICETFKYHLEQYQKDQPVKE